MFIRPTKVTRVTSGFRTKSRPNHHGIDYAQAGTHDIYAVADGTVSRSYTSSSYGECIMIVHNIGGQAWESVYAHLRAGSRRVREGQKVKQGQVIGIMGNTGRSSGQHLHFELHKGRWNVNKTNAVNPENYVGVAKFNSSRVYLRKGDRGQAVQELQTLLNKHGYKLVVDGIFGDKTYASVIDFQRDNNLKVDGIVGIQTVSRLKQPPQKRSSSVPYPNKVIKRGDRGKNVERIQRALNNALSREVVKVDGIFGAKTEQAVKDYQRRHKLVVDGKVGIQTWSVLF